MNLKVFTKVDCPNCPAAKALAKKLEAKGAKVIWCDLDEEDGLSEAVFCDVLSTPSLIITDDSDTEIKGWRGEIPGLDEISKELKL
ncbi:MAG: thioredoxin family protein [Candidatus Heimdallarchaeota archaeon]